MRPLTRCLVGVLVAITWYGRGVGSPTGPVVERVGDARDLGRFAFRVDTPAVLLAPGPGGRLKIQLQGFGTSERRPGAPDLPTHVLRVALPPGVVPRLVVREGGVRYLPGRPQPVPLREVEAEAPEGPDPDALAGLRASVRSRSVEDPAFYAAPGVQPAAPAWLGEIGVLRDQRYVEVHLAPVRFEAEDDRLRVASSLELEVAFDGDDGRRTAPTRDPRFEDVYRHAFVNYAEGTTFRLGALGERESATPTEAATLLTGPIHRIRVRANRAVRLDQGRVTGTPFLTLPLSTWKLSNRGVEVPLQVRDVDGDDLLDAGDWVQFYGQALDDEPKTVLQNDVLGEDEIYAARDFTDENVYFLTSEAGARTRMASRSSAPTMVRVPPTDFEGVAHQEVDDLWRPLGPNDPWSWSPTLQTGGTTSRTDSVPLPGLASPTAPVHVLVQVKATNESTTINPDHHTRVRLMNNSNVILATQDDDGTFEGREVYLHDFTWPGSGGTLGDPAKVQLELQPVGYTQSLALDWIELRYRRTFTAAGDALTFDWPDQDAEFIVSGLASSAPEVWDLTGRVGATGVVSPIRLTAGTVSGAGPFSIRFRMDQDPAIPDGTPRRIAVLGSGAIVVPASADFTADTESTLRSTAQQADLIVIAHPAVLDNPGACSSAALTSLLNFRAAQGITSKVVCLQDVQDEFNHGLPGPLAIRNFLAWVMSTTPGEGWASPKPAYVLLLGDGSYDSKGGTAQGDFVPTQMLFKSDPSIGYFASDNLMAAVSGNDSLADLVVGRLPARSVTEANVVLGKVLAYEQSPPAGPWRAHAITLSDRGKRDALGVINAGESFSFEDTNREGLDLMKVPPHTYREIRYYSDFCTNGDSGPCNSNQAHAAIQAAVNGTDGFSDGAALFQYTGHGNFDVWSDDAIWDDRQPPPLDSDSLSNGARLPWLLAHNCLTGGFHTTAATSLGEDWLKRSGGGAVAVFSPTGLSFNYIGNTVTETIWGALFGNTKQREVGVVVYDALSTLCGQDSVEACEAYVLLGDPSQQLALPTIKPASSLSATAGNAQVQLQWTASATPGALYDVYRTTNPGFNLVQANGGPVAGTSFLDTGVSNATTYYYHVVARDAAGFESAWSNFNSDCPVSGPDCVSARPLNPNPPSTPSGLVVSDPETGGRLDVSWSANPEGTEISAYTLKYGVDPVSPGDPCPFTWTQGAGRNTAVSITGLQNQTRYCFALTATNTSGHTSGLSAEQTGVPTFVRGLRSPATVTELRIGKSGADAVLTWTAVTLDIYGKPESVAHYEIFRGSTPTFVPTPANKIGQTSATTFTDPLALAAGAPNYYWLVRAVDVDGNVGGLGGQLPNGIDALKVDRGTLAGDIRLSWPAVTTTFGGGVARIARYDVYAFGNPFTRADIRNGTVPLLQSTTGTSLEITPPAQRRFYSVIVVDERGNVSSF